MNREKVLLPIRQYAKLKQKSRQEIYRLIRERRIPEGRVKKIEKTFVRMMIELTEEEAKVFLSVSNLKE